VKPRESHALAIRAPQPVRGPGSAALSRTRARTASRSRSWRSGRLRLYSPRRKRHHVRGSRP
jgi:hypothetical protein